MRSRVTESPEQARLKSPRLRRLPWLTVLVLAAGSIQAQALSPEQIKRQATLYAGIFASQRYVEAVSQACGPIAGRAGKIWNARNAQALERAEEVRATVREEIEIAAGAGAAKALEERQDKYLNERISRVVEEIEALPSERKRSFCAKFMESVENGQRDVTASEGEELVQRPLQQVVTVDRFLKSLAKLSTSRCEDRGTLAEDFAADGKEAEARSVRLAETALCECMPRQVQTLRATLTAKELEERITESEFQARYAPTIINKCAAEQLRAAFGEGCSELMAESRKDSEAYCECMLDAVSELSDEEAAQIGRESSNYLPLAASAKAQGTSMPDQPPGIRRMSDIQAACAAKSP